MAGLIYKICHLEDWAAAGDSFEGSAKDREDGFIHFSTAEQLPGTLARYYAEAETLELIAVNADALGEALRFEPSTGGALFPHLYAPMPRSAVAWSKTITKGTDGVFALPPEAI
jgi:uncharacterized protein (DUF952 family)